MDAFLKNIPSQSSETNSQQPQELPPTLSKIPPPQKIGKRANLQAQPLQRSIFVINQRRPASQVHYQAGARQQAPGSLNHRGGQGGGGDQVVGIQGVGGGRGQPTAMYQHHGTLPVPPGTAYIQGQVPLHPPHAAPHKQPAYAMNSQMQPIQFSCPPQRHQGHQNQSFYPSYQPTIVPNLFGYAPGPPTQHGEYSYAPQGPLNMGRAGAGAVTGGAPHVGSPLAAGQAEASGHNDGAQNLAQSIASRKRQIKKKAPMGIVDPKTGKDISSDQIYEDHDNKAAPTPQKFESIIENSTGSCEISSGLLSMEQIHEKLCSLMSNEKENSLENICGWISKNVNIRVRSPGFINVLMTAILEVSIEPYNNAWQFRLDKFQNLQGLITRYIDGNIKMSELQCLIAIQEYIQQLDASQRVLLQVIEKQLIESILSIDVSHASVNNRDSSSVTAKSVAVTALESFFTALNEADDESSN